MTTTTWETTRPLGRSSIAVSAMGFGCWAIGGPAWLDGKPIGWGEVDDAESIRAIHRALDLGVTFFDTAPVYGAGHSERVLGRALAGRGGIVVATKFGLHIDEAGRRMTGIMSEPDPAQIRAECEASLRRLNREAIDLFLCHPSELGIEHAHAVRDVLETLVADGLIRAHGWSTDDPDGAAIWAAAPHCAAVEHELNLVSDAPEMLGLCDREELASVNRSPLAMGLLTGKFRNDSRLSGDDVRGDEPAWMKWFAGGQPKPEFLARVESVREVLTSGGRTPAQGALAWIWARSGRTIPIPGFRTVAQVEENAGALRFGPLTAMQMAEIAALLDG
jgi:aryl-alcohol dehydrogenase-like predicted oxidoreductase